MLYHFAEKERFEVWNRMLKMKLGYPRASYNASTGAILPGSGTTEHVRGTFSELPLSNAVLVSVDERTIPEDMRLGSYRDESLTEYTGDPVADGFYSGEEEVMGDG